MSISVAATAVRIVRLIPENAPEPLIGRIIVPLDGSDLAATALEPARQLALRTGAHIHLLTTRVDDGDDLNRYVAASYLEDAATKLAGVETDTELRTEKDPVDAIAALLAESDEPTWIVMSSHGRGRVMRSVLGSVAERIVAEVDAPVMILGPSYDAKIHYSDGPVIVAHDATHSPNLGAAALLCQVAGARAVVVEVRSSLPELAPDKDGRLISPAVVDWADGLRMLGVEVTTEMRPGPSMPRSISEAATEIGASYVLLTSRANRGLRRFVLGSHTSATVKQSAVPVVVVRDFGAADADEEAAVHPISE